MPFRFIPGITNGRIAFFFLRLSNFPVFVCVCVCVHVYTLFIPTLRKHFIFNLHIYTHTHTHIYIYFFFPLSIHPRGTCRFFHILAIMLQWNGVWMSFQDTDFGSFGELPVWGVGCANCLDDHSAVYTISSWWTLETYTAMGQLFLNNIENQRKT